MSLSDRERVNHGINPITLHPPDGDPSDTIVMSRLHVTLGGDTKKVFSVMGTDKDAMARQTSTGAKSTDKIYYRHSGYPGGISATNFRDMQTKFPGRALEKAVKGMLPKGPLGYAMIKKLKVYGGAEHPHTAQQPEALDVAAMNPKNKRSA